ncbi:MAG: phenylalanine--tRNA ligase subunit alpha [Candidatus Woesearchaeota archaeon]|nr:phenylalanine--tRNA ligase subunit alpha [Candidatus Woesearchaeota archaeon]
MVDLKKLSASLHVLERKVLPLTINCKEVAQIIKTSGLKNIEVTRALQWLENKKLVEIKTQEKAVINLDKNGTLYANSGLPEKKFLQALGDKELTLAQVEKKAGIAHDELNICLGVLQRKAAIILSKERELRVKCTSQGTKLLTQHLPEELFLKKSFPIAVDSLNSSETQVYDLLKRRRAIIKSDIEKVMCVSITQLGIQLVQTGITDENVIDRLTPELLKSGEWKKKPMRRYDVTADVPKTWGGTLQPYKQFLEEVREKFLSLGFTESTGPIVEQEFWNMDALFMPQFHSARDIQDAYFIKEPAYTKINPGLIKRVRAAHENGAGTGSLGWRYLFDEQRTQRNVLRSHDTAVSPHTLSAPDVKIPGKYFQICRCFRHDVIDATHLADFDQIGGFVIEEGLTMQHLFGLLRMFAKEFAGIDEIKIVPSYFPFTEPSCELHAKHPQLGWIELAGAGLFRPEMIKPLVGKDISVIAWGIGISRLAMFSLKINDIRQLFSHDLEYLRNTPVEN